MSSTMRIAGLTLLSIVLCVVRVRAADEFEPDDSRLEARAFDVGDTELHDFHFWGDVDWVKFVVLPDYIYEVETIHVGTNVDTVLTVYFEQQDGTLINVLGEDVDYAGKGVGIGEMVLLTNYPSGTYYARVRSYEPADFGADTDYNLIVRVPSAPDGVLVVAAVDRLNPGSSPPGAVANVDGVEKAFNGATTVEYHGLSPGTYSVRVTVDAGYFPEQDPALPDQPANKDSYLYGNPKDVEFSADAWHVCVFQFVPYVKATGSLKDKWTGERVRDAVLEFQAKNGVIAGCVYDGYPNNAVYRSDWYSVSGGAFPTNVWLPCVDWDLTVIKGSHSNVVMKSCITGLSPGDQIDLGTIEMCPVDDNANEIGDDWEDRYFPSLPVNPLEDSDNDGHDNKCEYLCGTDPTNNASVFAIDDFESGHSVTLKWPVSPGRVYQVVSTNDGKLSTFDGWPVVAGPWEAAEGHAYMEWTGDSDEGHRYYRVKVLLP